MKIQELAALLNGREYREEITDAEEKLAADAGLVVAFGASDDLAEFRGAIFEEMNACNGGSFLVDASGVTHDEPHECDCPYCGHADAKLTAVTVEAVWVDDPAEDYCWEFRASVPYAGFDIMEDGEKYCRGIVFKLPELSQGGEQ